MAAKCSSQDVAKCPPRSSSCRRSNRALNVWCFWAGNSLPCSDSRIRRGPTVECFFLTFPLATGLHESCSFPVTARRRFVPSQKKSEYERRTGLELRKKKWNSCVPRRHGQRPCSLGTESTTHPRCRQPPWA